MDENNSIELMNNQFGFDLSACTAVPNLEDERHFSKLKLNSAQKMQVGALLHEFPSVASATALANAYVVKFPKGLPHALVKLKQGGFGSMVQGSDGKFVGSASFYKMSAQAAVAGIFSAMSIATSQYYLTAINNELSIVNQKIDKILDFLYGDKKAELMSEISFVQYAYKNYMSIMEHEAQRQATIAGLQESKKVAMKDIEFYMSDLKSNAKKTPKNYADFEKVADNTFQIKDSLELSIQLYIMSSIMEIHYAQNYDSEYIDYLRGDINNYVEKFYNRMISDFNHLAGFHQGFKTNAINKFDPSVLSKRFDTLIGKLNNEKESCINDSIYKSLDSFSAENEYYVNNDGEVFLRIAE